MIKPKSLLHKFWYEMNSTHFTWPKWINSISFLFTGCHVRGRMVGTRQVWFCLCQKQRVRYASFDTEETRWILLGLTTKLPFGSFYGLSYEVENGKNLESLVLSMPKAKSLPCKFWYRRNSHILHGLNGLNFFSFFLRAVMWGKLTVETIQVWFCLGQKRRVRYASIDTEGTRCILFGLNGWTLFCFFLRAVVRCDKR